MNLSFSLTVWAKHLAVFAIPFGLLACGKAPTCDDALSHEALRKILWKSDPLDFHPVPDSIQTTLKNAKLNYRGAGDVLNCTADLTIAYEAKPPVEIYALKELKYTITPKEDAYYLEIEPSTDWVLAKQAVAMAKLTSDARY